MLLIIHNDAHMIERVLIYGPRTVLKVYFGSQFLTHVYF